MRTLLKILAVVVVFFAAQGTLKLLSEALPGTPTSRLTAFMEEHNDSAQTLGHSLDSDVGRRLLSAHSLWIVLGTIPIASLLAAVVARLIRVPPGVGIIVIAVLVAARVGLMCLTSRVYQDLMCIVLGRGSDAGAPMWGSSAALALSVSLAGLILLPRRKRNAA
ncbi:MAG: hypothetical protein K6U00_08830 [Armatimonadetes bacterium]|nr:hypothetical protein [Armatimonadota bacterium]